MKLWETSLQALLASCGRTAPFRMLTIIYEFIYFLCEDLTDWPHVVTCPGGPAAFSPGNLSTSSSASSTLGSPDNDEYILSFETIDKMRRVSSYSSLNSLIGNSSCSARLLKLCDLFYWCPIPTNAVWPEPVWYIKYSSSGRIWRPIKIITTIDLFLATQKWPNRDKSTNLKRLYSF